MESSNVSDFLVGNIDEALQNLSSCCRWTSPARSSFHGGDLSETTTTTTTDSELSDHRIEQVPMQARLCDVAYYEEEDEKLNSISWACGESGSTNNSNNNNTNEFIDLERIYSFSSQMIGVYSRSPAQGITARTSFEDLLESTVPAHIATVEIIENSNNRCRRLCHQNSLNLREQPQLAVSEDSTAPGCCSPQQDNIDPEQMKKLAKVVEQMVSLNPRSKAYDSCCLTSSPVTNRATNKREVLQTGTSIMEEVEREMFSNCDGILHLERLPQQPQTNNNEEGERIKSRSGKLIDPLGIETPNCVLDLDSIFDPQQKAPRTPVQPTGVRIDSNHSSKRKRGSNPDIRKRPSLRSQPDIMGVDIKTW